MKLKTDKKSTVQVKISDTKNRKYKHLTLESTTPEKALEEFKSLFAEEDVVLKFKATDKPNAVHLTCIKPKDVGAGRPSSSSTITLYGLTVGEIHDKIIDYLEGDEEV